MRVFYVSALLALSFTQAAKAQTIVNGNFTPSGAVNACHLVSNPLYDSTFGGTSYAFSTLLPPQASDSGGFELFNASCNDGSPISGTYYLSMEWSDGLHGTSAGADAVSFKLSAALDTNHHYTLSFYAKSTIYPQYGVPSLKVGYSTDSMAFGDSIAKVASPGSSTWAQYTYTFKPHKAARWITLKTDSAVNSSTNNYIDVDAFTLSIPTDVPSVNENQLVQIAPNPFTTSSRVTLSNTAALPVQYSLYDITGKQVMHKEAINSNNFTIDRQSLTNGVYFLKVMDNNSNSYNTKLVAQ